MLDYGFDDDRQPYFTMELLPGAQTILEASQALNPADYKAWSFAVGCDASHGDSGSAMVDRESGKVVGIIWTGKFPKVENVQHSDYLNKMLASNSAEIWQELNYAVPSMKIQMIIQATILNEKLDSKVKTILQEVSQ